MIKMFLIWLTTTALGGFIGGRADQLSMGGIGKLKELLFQPENHDIAKAIAAALYKSLMRFFSELAAINQFQSVKEAIRDCEEAIESLGKYDPAEEVSKFDNDLLAELYTYAAPFIAKMQSESEVLTRAMAEDAIVSGLVHYLSRKTGTRDLVLLDRYVREGVKSEEKLVKPWIETFREYLSEAIKTNDRFREIFNTELIAANLQISRSTAANVETVIDLLVEITGSDAQVVFADFLRQHSRPAKIVYSSGNQLATRAGVEYSTVRLNEKFGIEVENPFETAVYFAMQESRGRWYLDNEPHPNLGKGTAIVPDGLLVESDRSDLGNRKFVVILFDGILPPALAKIQHSSAMGDATLQGIARTLTEMPGGYSMWSVRYVVRE